jgi:inosose dehydratase
MFHPHLGTIAQSPDQLDRLFRLTDISLCPDTGHIIAGGGDPVQIIRTYRDRIPYVHFKDYANGRFLPLGEGELDVKGVIDALGDVPADYWWTVELDETDKNPREDAEKSLNVLKKLAGTAAAS